MSSIVKYQRSEDAYEHISRAVLQDINLSLDAVGALCRLLSLPGDWEWQCWQLEKEVLKVGRDKRKRIFNELIDAGYLTILRSPNGENGGWQHTYNLYRTSQKLIEFSGDGKPVAGKPVDGKGVDIIHNTDLKNTELENTQPQQTASEAAIVGSGGHLIFDKAIDQNLHLQLTSLLLNVEPKFAQQMLDVLAGMGDKAKYSIKLIKSFIANPTDFDPTPGLVIARKRENERLAAEKRLEDDKRKVQLKDYDPAERIKAMRAALGI